MPYYPSIAEYDPYFQRYIDQAPSKDLLEALEQSRDYCMSVFRLVVDDESNQRYAPGRWTIKQVLLHIVDAEQILAYRALRIGRGDTSPLSGFDQNALMNGVDMGNSIHYGELVQRFQLQRDANILLYKTLGDTQLAQLGLADGKPTSAGALGFIIAGHGVHHANMIKQRYFKIF